MKVRHGFVSNSSSSSFAVFGIALTDAQITAIKAKRGDLYGVQDVGLDYYGGTNDGTEVIGLCPSVAPDDETFGQFKTRVAALIASVTGDKPEDIKVEFVSGEYQC